MPGRLRIRALFSALILAICVGPQIVLAQYGGPSILSRGGNQPGRRGRAPVNFTGYAGGGYRYESGLTLPVVDQTGKVPSTDDWGLQVEGGLYGGHEFRRVSL